MSNSYWISKSDPVAREWNERTGILFSWVKSEEPLYLRRLVLGCTRCANLGVVEDVAQEVIDYARFDVVPEIECSVAMCFHRDALRHDCEHWRIYVGLRRDPATDESVETIARLKQFPRFALASLDTLFPDPMVPLLVWWTKPVSRAFVGTVDRDGWVLRTPINR